jgi:hypothetical protein
MNTTAECLGSSKTSPYYKTAKSDTLDGGKCFHNLHNPILFPCTLDSWHILPGNIIFVDSRMCVAKCLSVSYAGVLFMTQFSKKKSMYHLMAKF